MSPVTVFLDTEFTSLEAPLLLSIGLVALSGDEFYAEMDCSGGLGLMRSREANDFARSAVLPQWGKAPFAYKSEEAIGAALSAWLGRIANKGQSVEVCYDWGVDCQFFEQVLREAGALPQWQTRLEPCNLSILNEDPAADTARSLVFRNLETRGIRQHHALADAWALRAAYLAQLHAPSPLPPGSR